MTNAQQIRKVYRPLLDRNPDLVRIGNGWLCIRPIRHVLLRVVVDRTSNADRCDPQWSVWSSFLYNSQIDATLGHHSWIKRPLVRLERNWLWSDPTMVEELICIIETETLPLLRTIDSFEKYAAFYREHFDRFGREWSYDRMLIDIALGDLDTARSIWRSLPASYREATPSSEAFFRFRKYKIDTVAEPLFADDRAALARILHGWEADNIARAGYERYWERTPFPLERAGD